MIAVAAVVAAVALAVLLGVGVWSLWSLVTNAIDSAVRLPEPGRHRHPHAARQSRRTARELREIGR